MLVCDHSPLTVESEVALYAEIAEAAVGLTSKYWSSRGVKGSRRTRPCPRVTLGEASEEAARVGVREVESFILRIRFWMSRCEDKSKRVEM